MDLEQTSKHLTGLLVKAAAAGDLRTVQVMLEAEADVNGRVRMSKGSFPGMPDRGWCALSVAAYGGHEHVVDALLRAGAAVRPSVISEILTMRSTPTAASAPNGGARMLACVAKLAARCRRIDFVPPWLSTPLQVACSAANPACVKLLLDAGADPAAGADAKGRLPIHALLSNRLASPEAISEVLTMLLDRRPELVDAADDDGVTPMAVAVRNNMASVVALLAERGADLTRTDALGLGYLDRALALSHTETAMALIDSGVPLNVPDRDPCLVRIVQCSAPGSATLSTQVRNGLILKTMLRAGADTALVDSIRGGTALHWAALTNNVEFARTLIEHGADPMARDENGRAPQDWVDPDPVRAGQVAEMQTLLREAVSARMGRTIEDAFARREVKPARRRQANTMTL